jgi:hypothetical protein
MLRRNYEDVEKSLLEASSRARNAFSSLELDRSSNLWRKSPAKKKHADHSGSWVDARGGTRSEHAHHSWD